MQTIEKNISAEPVTGFKRIARHEAFVILPDLNMVQQVRVITLEPGSNVSLSEKVYNNRSLTDEQRRATLQRYADQVITRQTAGAFVDATGQVVEPDAEGAIGQREFFQAITLGDLKKMGMPISDKTSVISLIYAMLGNEITNIDNRGGL